jgi:hypothetical protein
MVMIWETVVPVGRMASMNLWLQRGRTVPTGSLSKAGLTIETGWPLGAAVTTNPAAWQKSNSSVWSWKASQAATLSTGSAVLGA